MTPRQGIEQMVNDFEDRLTDLLLSIKEESMDGGKIKVGYNRTKISGIVRRIEDRINKANILFPAYCKLFKKKISIESFKEFELFKSTLNASTEDHADFSLKEQYLMLNNISIPSFPNFKMSALVSAYDFPIEAEQFFSLAKENIIALRDKESLIKYFTKDHLELSDKEVEKIQEDNVIYLEADNVGEILSLAMLAIALNSLRKEPYYFNDLPEIDHRLIKYFKRNTREAIRSLDLDYEAIAEHHKVGFETQIYFLKSKS